MKIATFNINNINRRLPNLLRWLRAAKPDIVSLQELKATDAEFPISAIEKAGYGAVWSGQKTWNGVAILARNTEPILTRDRLPGRPGDLEARYIEAAVRGIIVTSIYLPNGNPQPGPKFDYKLDWFARLKRHAKSFLKQDLPVVLAGDYNVAPAEIDIYPTRSCPHLEEPGQRDCQARGCHPRQNQVHTGFCRARRDHRERAGFCRDERGIGRAALRLHQRILVP